MNTTEPVNLDQVLSQSPEEMLRTLVKLVFEMKAGADSDVCPDWIPKAKVQEYLGYQDTQFSSIISSKQLVSTKLGRRLFVHKDSITALLNNNIQK
jgi:hypothetical protein